MRIGGPTGDRGSGPPKIRKLLDFLAILVRIPRIITRLPSQHSMLGHHRYDSETPFKWRFAGGPMLARLWSQLVFGSSLSSSTKKKNVVKVSINIAAFQIKGN